MAKGSDKGSILMSVSPNGLKSVTNSDILMSVATLRSEYEGLKADIVSTRADMSAAFQSLSVEFKSFKEEFNKSRQLSWPLIISAVLAVSTIFGAAFAIADKNSQILLAPVVTQNQVSVEDRAQIHKALDTLEGQAAGNAAELKAFEAKTTSDLKEIETQFRAQEQLTNAVTADMWRVMEEEWDTLANMGAKMPQRPVGPFFSPSLMNDGISK